MEYYLLKTKLKLESKEEESSKADELRRVSLRLEEAGRCLSMAEESGRCLAHERGDSFESGVAATAGRAAKECRELEEVLRLLKGQMEEEVKENENHRKKKS